MESLKSKLFYIFFLLVIYRFGSYIPLPGVDTELLKDVIDSQKSEGGGGIFYSLNIFSGGSLQRMTVFALGVIPYITVSIVMQLLTAVSPSLANLKKSGQEGRLKLAKYTRYGTILVCIFQALGVFLLVKNMGVLHSEIQDQEGSLIFIQFLMVITLVSATMLLVWFGEKISLKKLGNGISLIIFVGIVAELPDAISFLLSFYENASISGAKLFAVIVLLLSIFLLVVVFETANRIVAVQYPKGRAMSGNGANPSVNYVPLKVNVSGVLPPIFAGALLSFPYSLSVFFDGGGSAVFSLFAYGKPFYFGFYSLLIIFFCFFYVANVFKADDLANNVKKSGGYIPGVRPGDNTAKYFNFITNKLAFVSAVYLCVVCVLSEYIFFKYIGSYIIGGTSILILVNVILDSMNQIKSHMFSSQYKGILKRSVK